MSDHFLYGMRVIIAPEFPRIQVSSEFARLQSKELVDSTNAWMASFFGYQCAVPDGQALISKRDNTVFLSAKSFDQLNKLSAERYAHGGPQ